MLAVLFFLDLHLLTHTSSALPSYSHANVVGQGNDGGDGYGKHGLWIEINMIMVSIAED